MIHLTGLIPCSRNLKVRNCVILFLLQIWMSVQQTMVAVSRIVKTPSGLSCVRAGRDTGSKLTLKHAKVNKIIFCKPLQPKRHLFDQIQ